MMKLAKSLLLGSAAALVATAGAQAADLPYRKAAPVEYVRVCDWTGAGYFYIPGTDTCLKIGGFVRGEFEAVNERSAFIPPHFNGGPSGATAAARAASGQIISGRNRDMTGFFARGRLTTDARTQTAYGVLRTFIQAQFDRYSGAENYSSTYPQGQGSAAYIDKAFIQFAGITAGRVQSFFDDGADPVGFEGVATTDSSTQAFAYTYTAGGGFSATISVEDPNPRRVGILNTLGTANNPVAYAGDQIPDIIGAVRYDQAWGHVQLSGAYHQLRTSADFISPASHAVTHNDDEGYAGRGSVVFKLPMLAAGDEFGIEGGYANGAFSYADSNLTMGGYGNSILVGGFQHASADAIAITGRGANYTLAKSEVYSVSGDFIHFFTPTINAIVFGSYEDVNYGRGGRVAWYNGGVGPSQAYRIAGQTNWYPVKDLQIGVEFMYIKVNQKVPGSPGDVVAGSPTVAIPAGIKRDPDAYVGRLRIERDF